MKKKLFFTAIILGFESMSVSAQKVLVKEVFYGEKQSKSRLNPCKGYCERVCGERTYNVPIEDLGKKKKFFLVADNEKAEKTSVDIVTKDAEGNILHRSEAVYEGNAEKVAESIMNDLPLKKAE